MKMTRLAMGLARGIAFGGSVMAPNAQAQFAVIDVANMQQQIVQYANMIQQLQQLQAQLSQAQKAYAAITGGRGMGGLSKENFTANVPKTWQETLNAMNGGGKVGALANQIKNAASQLQSGNFEGVSETVLTSLDQGMDRAASGQALNAQVFEGSGARFDRIQSLMGQIDSATDAKAAADLNNRIAAENAMLMNELIKLQAMNAMLAQQQQVNAQTQAQKSFEMTSRKY